MIVLGAAALMLGAVATAALLVLGVFAMITASQVTELRVRTGAGIQSCQRALTEFDGDPEQAAWFLRVYGQAVVRRYPIRWPSEDSNCECEGCGAMATPGVVGKARCWTPTCACGVGLVPYTKAAARRNNPAPSFEVGRAL